MSTKPYYDRTAKSAFKTFVHIVPPAQNHPPEEKVSRVVKVLEAQKELFLNNPLLGKKSQRFTFDHSLRHSLSSNASDECPEDIVWQNLCAEVTKNTFDGFNSCLLSYGQLGTSSFMFENNGIINAVTENLQKHGADMAVGEFYLKCSMIEVYDEKLTDLLEPTNSGKLKYREMHTILCYFISTMIQHLFRPVRLK